MLSRAQCSSLPWEEAVRNEARWLHGRGGGEANSPTWNSNYSIDIPHTITLSSLICITSLAVLQQMNACDRVRRHVGEQVFHILWLPRQGRRLKEETGVLSLQGSEVQLSLWSESDNSRWKRAMVLQVCEMAADVGGPCLTPWLMAIGHRLSHLYFFCSLALSFQGSHWSGALRHRIIYCCQESWGQRGRRGIAEGAECCREEAVEGMGRGRHARLSNLYRWIFNEAWSVYLVSLSIFTALSIAAPV